MERDFTITCFEGFCAMIDQIKDENWCGISDWFGDRFLDVRHLLVKWGILDRTTEIEAYYKELLDRKNASAETVAQVFEDISNLDRSASEYSHFGHCRKTLEAYRKYITNLTLFATDGQAAEGTGTLTTSALAVGRIQAIMGSSWRELQKCSLPVIPDYQFTSSSFFSLSRKEKDAYISRCEEICPDWAAAIDQALSDSDWADYEKRDIKFLIYSAPEPYRSIYLKNLSRYNIVVFQKKSEVGSSYNRNQFVSWDNAVYVKDGPLKFLLDDRGPYITFFHECGHAVDHYAYEADSLSCCYWYNDKSLLQYIKDDTRKYVSDLIDKRYPMMNEDQKEQLLVALNLSDESSYKYGGDPAELTSYTFECYQDIKASLLLELFPSRHVAASDIYGGVTNNAIVGSHVHMKGLFQKSDNYSYWWSAPGFPSSSQASELWAHFFAAKMTYDDTSLASIQKHFPTAYQAMEEMAREIAAQ